MSSLDVFTMSLSEIFVVLKLSRSLRLNTNWNKKKKCVNKSVFQNRDELVKCSGESTPTELCCYADHK